MLERMLTGWTKLSAIAMAAGLSSLVGAAILFVLSLSGVIGDDPYTGPPPAPTIVPLAREVVQIPLASPTSPAAPLPTPSTAAIAHLAIPRFDVVAPIVVLGVDGNGVMETPDGPTSVAWYEFSARPGFPAAEGGNAVFSGHVDYYNYGPAVFWHLKDLERDDVIEVILADGTTYRYGVVSRQQVGAATADVKAIVGDTAREIITLITCGGTFNPNVGEYDQRVIVRAARIHDDAPETLDAGDVR